jgi:hypothetical protein
MGFYKLHTLDVWFHQPSIFYKKYKVFSYMRFSYYKYKFYCFFIKGPQSVLAFIDYNIVYHFIYTYFIIILFIILFII